MDSRNTITSEEMELVKKIAAWTYKKYWSDNMKDILTLNDLYHTGIIGLLEAKKKIDPDKNPEAYLATRVRGTIIDFIRKQTLIRVPKEKWQQVKAVRVARRALEDSGQESHINSIARHLGWPVEAVKKAEAVKLSVINTDESHRQEDGIPIGIVLIDKDLNPEEQVLRNDLAVIIQKCLETIKEKLDRIILISRIQHSLKLKVLAQSMRLSIEGVRKKENRAKEQMKKCLEAKGWSKDSLPQA